MKITVSPKAQKWFTEELELETGDNVRFFGKYGGATNVHAGFTTGMEVTEPHRELLGSVAEGGINYFAEESDDWFFHGHDLLVDYDEKKDEPTYFYTEDD
ncbi:hypothetical protein [uncultured Vagococcus sp.]|uniref:HesB/YadR/YfhF family protein n=1 Tax=uncultured Vagococcus sp. TaxID=189676 RepID=UPI0028D5C495|nr:hypothetical protein [uncultured Vagococcus sp.]